MDQRKILLLENVATQAAGVREHLSQAGFQVAVSRYEADGLKRLVEWVPDLVLVSTSHPAGDFVEYCRRVRALAPAVRVMVTSSLNRERLFHDYPGLQTIVDGVLLRPYSHEEVAAALASVPPVPGLASEPGTAELRTEFQRQLDAKFLEIEELKRHLEVASKRVASTPGLEWLQSENEHLRQAAEETRKKAALALATEQLKRSEIEVKLDNLLRMKEDFEFRTQNELEDRAREIDLQRAQLQELRERSDKAAGEHAALRLEMESALVEKEQLEERLHAQEAIGTGSAASPDAPPGGASRIAELEEELSRQRTLAAEGQVALADMAAKAAVLEESASRELAAREKKDQLLVEVQSLREGAAAARTALAAASAGSAALEKELADVRQAREAETRQAQEDQSGFAVRTRELLERIASAERSAEEALAARAELEARLSASEAARRSVAAEAETLVEQTSAKNVSLAAELERERAARAGAEQRTSELGARLSTAEPLAAEAVRLRARLVDQAAEIQRLTAAQTATLSAAAIQDGERRDRELAESRERARELEARCELLAGEGAERERVLAGEGQAWRDRAEAAALEILQLRSREAERVGREENERRAGAERQERAGRDLAERERQLVTLREELAAVEEARRREVRELEARVREAEAASRETGGRLEVADAALADAREGFAAREREARLQVESQQRSLRELQEELAARTVPEPGANQAQPELRRIQELLEEVISRARVEAVDYARRETELSTRLQTALDERRLLQERFDRASAEATERERRASSLLQSAIDRGPSPAAERANLPALVPLDPTPRAPRRWYYLAALAAVSLAAALAILGLRSTTRRAAHEQAPVVPRQQAGVPPGAAATPRAVWERWTRSDGSGGVLVQATLRSEQELRAEVESDLARGASEEAIRAELARRLGAFRFDTTHYVVVYLKNLAPGYPAYLDDLPGHFRLRDSGGREVPAFLPPGHEKDRRIYSFGAGAPGNLIYEASVSLGFDRAGISPSGGYLQLVVTDVGAASRRVLTWELE